ncbi:MAG: NAD-dependent epimerase/dehydratase family protein, partial [Alcanivoracaceae bacterium]|nr:NAD-dependent epimerase/dehydratase family protein [Alcanivoracaceae bacterium]
MKCLVTGATGFIGRELCQQLAAAGHEFVAYSFSGQTLECGTASTAVDLRKDSPNAADMAWADVVFHLAGIAHQQAKESDYQQVNHEAVVRLADEARKLGVK